MTRRLPKKWRDIFSLLERWTRENRPFLHATCSPVYNIIIRKGPNYKYVHTAINTKQLFCIESCIHGIGPAYFGDVCAPVTDAPRRTNLRSATRGDLLIPQTQTKLGERSFRIAAPTVWNSLPYSLKHATSREHFRKELKTYMFRKPTHQPLRTIEVWTYLLTYY